MEIFIKKILKINKLASLTHQNLNFEIKKLLQRYYQNNYILIQGGSVIYWYILPERILVAKARLKLNLKIQMLAGKETLFERFFKALSSLVYPLFTKENIIGATRKSII